MHSTQNTRSIDHAYLFRELKKQVKANLAQKHQPNPFVNAITFLKKQHTPSKLELMADYYRNFHELPKKI